ncbi:hypothetical protein [Verrucomicrobium sp. BvORR106]|uniref:hypothetical protein n=1 Tax=Verrucomicrobium sp. BvORR106 TaxID=1403819 RepID=UPI002240ED28|nr:hypothetical protein [Verrucomicrobium sp. BvORR106]
MQPRVFRAAVAAAGLLCLPALMGAQPNLAQPVNPALLYWQGIGLLTEMTRNEVALLQGHRNGNHWDPENVRAILSHQKAALNRFAKAGVSTAPCDWGLTLEEGPFMPLPHLGKMQTLSNLALMKAALEFSESRPGKALDALEAVRRAARHVAEGDMIVTAITQYSMESDALALLAKHLLTLDEATRKELLTRETKLPPLHTMAQAISGERGFAAWAEQQATEVATLMMLQNSAQAAGATETGSTPPLPHTASGVDEHLFSTLTPELLNTWLAEMRSRYADAESALSLPWPQSQSAIKELQEKLKAGNPLVRTIFPSLQAARDTQARTETHLLMVKLALQHGAGLTAEIAAKATDSFAGQPLQFKSNPDGGYTLSSQQVVRGKPVALKVAGLKQN